MTELRPCPFCGDTGGFACRDDVQVDAFSVHCPCCYAIGPTAHEVPPTAGELRRMQINATAEEAVEAWNTRA